MTSLKNNSDQPPPYELQENKIFNFKINKQMLRSKTSNYCEITKNEIITSICETIEEKIFKDHLIRFIIVITAEPSITRNYIIEHESLDLSIRNKIYLKFNPGLVLLVVVKDDNMIEQLKKDLTENNFLKSYISNDPRLDITIMGDFYNKYKIDIKKYPIKGINLMINYNLIKDDNFAKLYKNSCEQLVTNNFLQDLEENLTKMAERGDSKYVLTCTNPDMIYEYLTFHKLLDVSIELDTRKIIFSW